MIFEISSNRGLSKKGVSPFIASVLTILFGVLMLTLVLGVVNPIFSRAKDSSVITDAFQNLNLLNSVIKEVSSEAEGSKRTVAVSVSGGEYSINLTTDLLVFTYDPSEDMYLTGRKGDIYIERGSVFLDFFNWYVEDSTADPVWTNTSGQWIVDNYKYKGDGGLAYHNLGTLENYKFSGDIYNSSGATGGQIFMVAGNPERMVGFWSFDNKTGNKSYDYSANQNNGTFHGMNLTGNSTSGWQNSADCKAGLSCLKFDGSNDYVNVPESANLNLSNEITVEAWFKVSNLTYSNPIVRKGASSLTWDVNEDGIVDVSDRSITSVNYGRCYVLDEGYIGPPWPRWDIDEDGLCDISDITEVNSHLGETGKSTWFLQIQDNFYTRANENILVFSLGKSPETGEPLSVISSKTFTDDDLETWFHVAGTYDNSTISLYINGVLDNSTSVSGSFISNETLRIGAENPNGRAALYYFNGTIDEVKIWNVSLTAGEVAAEYELSAKKIKESGSQSIGAKTNASIVLANPDGITSFDNIKISRTNRKKQKLVIPYSNIDLNGTLRIVKGEHRVAVEHMGTNTTLNEPIIQITS